MKNIDNILTTDKWLEFQRERISVTLNCPSCKESITIGDHNCTSCGEKLYENIAIKRALLFVLGLGIPILLYFWIHYMFFEESGRDFLKLIALKMDENRTVFFIIALILVPIAIYLIGMLLMGALGYIFSAFEGINKKEMALSLAKKILKSDKTINENYLKAIALASTFKDPIIHRINNPNLFETWIKSKKRSSGDNKILKIIQEILFFKFSNEYLMGKGRKVTEGNTQKIKYNDTLIEKEKMRTALDSDSIIILSKIYTKQYGQSKEGKIKLANISKSIRYKAPEVSKILLESVNYNKTESQSMDNLDEDSNEVENNK